MKQTKLSEIKRMRKEVETDYVMMDVALAATGFTREQMLEWCQERNIRHLKRSNRWLVHKHDLASALQENASKS